MVPSVLLVVSQLFLLGTSLGITGKLDFGNSHHASLVRSIDHSVPIKYTKTIKVEESKTPDTFENIGVICSNEGCNSTKTDDSQGIEADVIVHVQTKIPVKNDNEKTHLLEDTPDVPVVVGYASSTLDSIIDDETTRPMINTQKNIIIPSNFDILDDRALEIEPISYPRPPTKINVQMLPSVPFSTSYDAKNLVENPISAQRPYFTPQVSGGSYYGEEPPQNFVWHSNSHKQTYNPVEFKNIYKNTWTPSTWTGRNINVDVPHRHYGGSTICDCRNNVQSRNGLGGGLQWKPGIIASRRVGTNNINRREPGVKIDDKLAPPFHENH